MLDIKMLAASNVDTRKYLFDILSISDKRTLICTCKDMYVFSMFMPDIEKKFQTVIKEKKYLGHRRFYGFYNPLYKYTIELLFDGYMMPDRYIISRNKILYAYPKIYRDLIKRGNLPLIKKMLKINDTNFTIKNYYAIIHAAAKSGNIKIIEWLIIKKNYGRCENLIASAAKGGQFETLKWLEEQNFIAGDLAACYAAGNGHTDILKYLVNDKQIYDISGYDAASKGRIDMVKHLYSLCPTSLCDACRSAAKAGHLDILKFAYENGEKLRKNFVCGHLHVLTWLIDNDHIQPRIEISEMVASTGSLECLQLLYAHEYPIFTESVFYKAVCGKNIDMIVWLLKNNCPYDKFMFIQNNGCDRTLMATVATSLPILKLLFDSGHLFSDHFCVYVSYYGNLEILDFLIQKGFKLSKGIIEHAAARGHLHIIVWAREHGCEWDVEACAATVGDNHLDVLRWLRGFDRKTCGLPSNETEICPWNEDLCTTAGDQNRDAILEFASTNGCENVYYK